MPGPPVSHVGSERVLTTTHRASFHAEGKTGAELIEASRRQDGASSLKGDVMMRHGSFLESPVHCLATTYQLTTGNTQPDRKVQGYLWQGNKQNDLCVPLATTTLSLTQQKRQSWSADASPAAAYKSTWRAATHGSALASAEDPAGTRVRTARPAADGGQIAQVGRKPTGDCVNELDKNYRRTGLRTAFY